MCDLTFFPDEPDDRAVHKEVHKKLERCGLPLGVREFLKAFGWSVAHDDGRIERLKDKHSEEGKLAVAYFGWARAKMNGIEESEFDEYMAAHLHFIDEIVEGNTGKIDQTRIKRWGKYVG